MAQAEYYTIEEACEYLKLKHGIESITTASLFRYLEKYQIPLWVYYQDYNIHINIDLEKPKISEYSCFKVIAWDMIFDEEVILEGKLHNLELKSHVMGFDDLLFEAISELEMSIKYGLLLQVIDWQNPNIRAGVSIIETNCYYAATNSNYEENREKNIAFGKGFGISLMIDRLMIGERRIYSDKDFLVLHHDLISLIDLIQSNAPPPYYSHEEKTEQEPSVATNTQHEALSIDDSKPVMRWNEQKTAAKLLYALLKSSGYELNATKGKANDALVQLTKSYGVPVSRETVSKWLQAAIDVAPIDETPRKGSK